MGPFHHHCCQVSSQEVLEYYFTAELLTEIATVIHCLFPPHECPHMRASTVVNLLSKFLPCLAEPIAANPRPKHPP